MATQEALLYSIIIGVAAGSLIYVALSYASKDGSTRRALAVASYGVGVLVTWYLYQTPNLLGNLVGTVVRQSASVILAALGAALAFWRRRS